MARRRTGKVRGRRQRLSARPVDAGNVRPLDRRGTAGALAVVIAATALSALGGLIWAAFAATPPPIFTVDLPRFLVRSILLGSLVQITFWFVWMTVTWLFLRHVFLLRAARWRELVRVCGYAFAPMALQVLMLVQVLEFPVGMIAVAATFGVTLSAVSAVSHAGFARAFVATLAGFMVFTVALGVLGNDDWDLAPGIFALNPNGASLGVKLNPDFRR